jgi:hypothetical protein
MIQERERSAVSGLLMLLALLALIGVGLWRTIAAM